MYEYLLANIDVDTAGAGCNTCLSELLLGLVIRNAWGGSREQTTVEAPAGVTTLGTRALAVGLGDRLLRVGPRCGYIHGKHAEWTSRLQDFFPLKILRISSH